MLSVYRRHKRECKAGHPHELRTSEFEERKKGWKRCDCPIFASGTLNKVSRRQSTAQWEWEAARQVAAALEQAGSWTGSPAPPAPVVEQEPASKHRITIADAIKVYLSNREGAKIAKPTLRKYKTFTKQITAFAESRGYAMLDQFTSGDIDLLYAGWEIGARTKGKKLGTLKAFFRFCTNREWLAKNPVSADIKPPMGANKVANKAPFTDDELKRIIEACDALGDVVWSNGAESGVYTGEDIKDFIWLSIYTGLRISDVGFFNIDRLNGNEVFLRAKKNGGDVFTYIPDWLRERLTARATRYGKRLFIVGKSDRMDTVTDMWRRKINRVFDLAGAFDEPATPHRFRHTFARILLERGVPVADVADLMGDDEKTIRVHYARWVKERQARLTKILTDAFEDKPKPGPKLVAMGGR